MSLGPVTVTLLEKAAVDNGFDLERGKDGEWLAFGSSQAPSSLWLSALGEPAFLAAFSRADIGDALGQLGETYGGAIPQGAAAARSVPDVASLHRLVRRAFQLARALPDEPLKAFLDQTAGLPRGTEAERLVIQRVGQEVFRERLLDFWEGRCAITDLAVPELLRASHIKPWAACETDAQRLDVFNGLLLAPHLDAAFDRGFISVADDGAVLVAEALDANARALLGLGGPLRVRVLTDSHRRFLRWHRERILKS